MRAKPNETAGLKWAPETWPEPVDHGRDSQTEGDRDAELTETTALGIDHDRARAEEDEREGAERLGGEAAGGHHARPPGASSASRPCTRASISSRIARTASRSFPAGSSSSQST